MKYVNQVVRIAELAVARPMIEGHEFENCLIVGPAVVAPMNCQMMFCEMGGEGPDALLWEIEEGLHVGAIGLVGCSFKHCRFQGIGFAGTKEFCLEFMAGTVPEEQQDG